MWWLLSAWVAGEFIVLCSWQMAACALVPLVLLWCWRPCRRSVFSPAMLVLAGVLIAQLCLGWQLADWLPASLNGKVVTLTGQVDGLPVTRPGRHGRPTSYRISLHHVQLVSGASAWPGQHQIRLYDYGPHQYHPGDWLTLKAKLYRPRGLVNEGSVDYARIALAYGQDASGSIKAVLAQRPGSAPVDKLRNRISQHIRTLLKDRPQAAGLVPAMVVGDWRYLSGESWSLYQQAGVAHLVVISGGHLTLVAGLVWGLLRFLCVPLLRWRGWKISAQQWALLPALLVTIGYCLLAGWSVSTLRALIMLSVWFACRLFRWRWPKRKVLAVALLAVLVWQPLSPLSNGFWLSFLAVGLLLLVAEGRPGMVSLQCVMSLVLGALAAFLFSQWGLAPLVANLVLIPLFSIVEIPVALVGSLVPGAGKLLLLLAPLVHWQEILLQDLLNIMPGLPIPATWLGTACLMLALLLAQIRFLPWPVWSLPFLLLPWIWPLQPTLQNGQFELLMFDVGQGQATLIRTAEGLVLYDMGPAWYASNAGGKVIRPWLRKQRLPVLLAVASHGDADHAGGLVGLQSLIPDGRLYSGEPQRVQNSRACIAGQHWRFSGVNFQVIWPPAGIQLEEHNANSCVIKVTGKNGSVLLTGDIPRQVEFWLVNHKSLSADALQLAHHGSDSSNSYAFLRAVSPQYALASVGYLNYLGLPDAQVEHKLAMLGIPLLRTDYGGMLRLSFDARGQVIWHRERSRIRPWEAHAERSSGMLH